MRRGLMQWNPEELPRNALDARLALLREGLRAEKLDGFVAYTNIARGAAVAWLSGFQPYWNEGLFYVATGGDVPVFATALSKRVAEWIGSVMPVGEVTTTPKPALLIGQKIAHGSGKRIGILELDDFPAGHAQLLLETAPGIELIDATAAFAKARAHVDEAERNLLNHAARLAEAGLAGIDPGHTTSAQDLLGPCDEQARKGGAEECFATIAPDLSRSASYLRTDTAGPLGKTFAVRSSLAYKATWVRRARSFTSDPSLATPFAQAEAALAAFKAPETGRLDPAIRAHFAGNGVEVRSWLAEQPRGGYPLTRVAGSNEGEDVWQAGAPFVLDIELSLGGTRWLGAKLVA
jgi:hypothetical protein